MVLVDFAQIFLYDFDKIISKIIIQLKIQLDISRILHISKIYVPMYSCFTRNTSFCKLYVLLTPFWSQWKIISGHLFLKI